MKHLRKGSVVKLVFEDDGHEYTTWLKLDDHPDVLPILFEPPMLYADDSVMVPLKVNTRLKLRGLMQDDGSGIIYKVRGTGKGAVDDD